MAAPMRVSVAVPNLLRRCSRRGWRLATVGLSSPYSNLPSQPSNQSQPLSPSEMERQERRGLWLVEYRENGVRVPPDLKPSTKPSVFPKLEMPNDLLVWLQQDFDMSITGFRSWWARKKEERDVYNQRYIPQRFQILGADLSAAHFLVHRDGAVRFVGSDQWVQKDENGNYTLPQKFVSGVKLEAIDVAKMDLLYDGLINIELVSDLRWLSLRNSSRVDDWFLDRICGLRDTLEYLDLSGCVNVTERGLTVLPRFRKLKFLKLYDMAHVKHLNLLCILLEEAMPNCKIEGVDYMNPSVLHSDGEQSKDELPESETPSMTMIGQKAVQAIAGKQSVVRESLPP